MFTVTGWRLSINAVISLEEIMLMKATTVSICHCEKFDDVAILAKRDHVIR
ncbi:MAG: hypothetical protein J4N97_12250 [Chloroflexi bacterium]|nr:hypothetical protein [Chloroflexota bacterium]